MLGDMETKQGNAFMAKKYADKATQLAAAIQKNYWVPEKGLYALNTDKKQYAQHSQALAILCDLVKGNDAKTLAEKMMSDKSLDYCTVYFKFYLHMAAAKAGLGDQYMDWLDIWRENISMGLTTWGETSDVNSTRSDCHAWGASPNIEFYRILLGIDSAAPAFKQVKIEPKLGGIKKIGGTMPHPQGAITVAYEYKKEGKGKKAPEYFSAEIELPAQVSGTFVWEGKTYSLHGGKNTIDVK